MKSTTGLTERNHPLLLAWDSRIKNLTKKDKIAIFHDADPDGVTSAVLVAKLIQAVRGKKPDLVLYREEGRHAISDKIIALLKRRKISLLITCDMALDETPETVIEAAKQCRIIMLDHHKVYQNMNAKNSQNILVIKPQLVNSPYDPACYSTAKLAYDLGSRLTDMSQYDWIASVGAIGDMGFKVWSAWLRAVLKKYNMKKNKNWFDTKLGLMTRIISSAQSTKPELNQSCFRLLESAKRPRDVLQSSLRKYRDAIEKELQSLIKEFKNCAEKHDDLCWYEVQPRLKVKGPLSSMLGMQHPHNTVLVVDTSGDIVHVSARRSDRKIAVNQLVEQAIKRLPGAAGGGHVPAAGATLRKQDLAEFKKRILEHTKIAK